MPPDKKDYIDTVESLTALATFISIRGKLNKVRARTEDQKLVSGLDAVIRVFDASRVRIATTPDLTRPEFKALFQYCKETIESGKPQWQVLAERHGWIFSKGN